MRLRSYLAAACLLLPATPAAAREASAFYPPSEAGAVFAHGAPRVNSAYRPLGERQPGFDPVARDAWLADCHERLGARDYSPATGECEAYLEHYYQAYTQGLQASGYVTSAKPPCVETIEYVTEEVTVQPRRRTVAPRRSKVVPDKRIKLIPVK